MEGTPKEMTAASWSSVMLSRVCAATRRRLPFATCRGPTYERGVLRSVMPRLRAGAASSRELSMSHLDPSWVRPSAMRTPGTTRTATPGRFYARSAASNFRTTSARTAVNHRIPPDRVGQRRRASTRQTCWSEALFACGRCRIRTCVGIRRRIYSPLPLAARTTCHAHPG